MSITHKSTTELESMLRAIDDGEGGSQELADAICDELDARDHDRTDPSAGASFGHFAS